MSRAARPPKPIESFGPELLQALIDGSKKEITLDLTYRQAVYYRQRMNALRAEMRRQNHQLYPLVSQATIRVVWGEDAGLPAVDEKKSSTNVRFPSNKSTPSKLVISPPDASLGAALKKAGVEVRPLAPDSVPNTGTQDVGDDVLESYLREEPPENVK